MATDFNYVSEYASLGVNLNRQKYGPLDGSSVFKSMNDLTYYVITSKNAASILSSDSSISTRFNEIFEATDEYLKNLACYAYVGQTVAVVENGTTKIYKITNVPKNVEEVREVLSSDDFCKQIDDVDHADVDALCAAISGKIWIDNLEQGCVGYKDLSVVKITKNDFDSLAPSAWNPQTIYVVSGDYVDVHGEQIKNLANATELSDAVNLKQLRHVEQELVDKIQSLNSETTVLTSDGVLSVISKIHETGGIVSVESEPLLETMVSGLTADLETLSNLISTKVFIKQTDELASFDNLSVVKILKDDYDKLIGKGTLSSLSNVIFVVDGDIIDAYGERIINVEDGINSKDAVNIRQIKNLSCVVASKITAISNKVDSKIWFNSSVNGEPTTGYNDLSIIKIGNDEYEELVVNGDISALSNVVFEVSSVNINAYGGQIKNVANATDDKDAVNYSQLNSSINSLQKNIVNILSDYPNLTGIDFSNVQLSDVGNMLQFIFQKLGGLADK